MTASFSLMLAIILVAFAAIYAFRSWKHGRFGIRDRVSAIAESVGLAALFSILAVFTGWAGVPIALWIVAVVLAAVGVAGLVLRSGDLPWLRTRKRLPLRVIRLVISGLACGAVLVLGTLAYS